MVAPGLYQCAVGLVGVYDLDLLYNDGDVRMRKAGRNYLEEVVGRDEAELRQFSPVFHAEKLSLPVFLSTVNWTFEHRSSTPIECVTL